MEFKKAINCDLFQKAVPEFVTLTSLNVPYQIGVNQQIIRFITDLADASGIVTLPSKAEACGKAYYICAPTGATAGDISVYDKEAAAEVTTLGDLDADDDYVIFWSDGVVWRCLLDGVA
jgi:hypothetical protein